MFKRKTFLKKSNKILSRIIDGKEGIIYHEVGSKFLFIIFGGFAHKIMGQRPLVLINFLKDSGWDVIFLRDFKNSWYHFGVSNVGEDIDVVAKYLKNVSKEYETVITLGNSMGGYASILFGSLIGADMCFSFGPQTFIDQKNRDAFGERFSEQKSKVRATSKTPQYFDLRNYLKKQTQNKTKYYIFYGLESRLDKIHAERIRGFGSFHLFGILGEHHISEKTAQKLGLKELVQEIIESKNSETITNYLRSKDFLSEID